MGYIYIDPNQALPEHIRTFLSLNSSFFHVFFGSRWRWWSTLAWIASLEVQPWWGFVHSLRTTTWLGNRFGRLRQKGTEFVANRCFGTFPTFLAISRHIGKMIVKIWKISSWTITLLEHVQIPRMGTFSKNVLSIHLNRNDPDGYVFLSYEALKKSQ